MSIFAPVFLLSLTGCGGGAEGGKPVYPASGTLKMFGAPVAGATVAFAPTVAGQPTAFAKTDAEGNFTLTTYEYGDGAAEGKFNVVVTKIVPAGAESESAAESHGDNPDYSSGSSHSADADTGGAEGDMIPPQYGSSKTTPLSVEVKSSGENVFPLVIE